MNHWRILEKCETCGSIQEVPRRISSLIKNMYLCFDTYFDDSVMLLSRTTDNRLINFGFFSSLNLFVVGTHGISNRVTDKNPVGSDDEFCSLRGNHYMVYSNTRTCFSHIAVRPDQHRDYCHMNAKLFEEL